MPDKKRLKPFKLKEIELIILFAVKKKSKKEYEIDTTEAMVGETVICPDNDLEIEKLKDGAVKLCALGKTKFN